ncbi:MAG: hypothetical protein HGB19_02765 [Chlorobiales bacterium]|nr:hypothetical protein [Chlorobiales bacterium]
MRYGKLFLTIALLLVGVPLFAQRSDLQVTGGLLGNPQSIYVVDLLTLSDQLPANRGIGKDILFIELTNKNEQNAYLHILFSKDGQQIAEGVWRSKTPVQRARLTNTNLSQSPYSKVITPFKIDKNEFERLAGNTSTSGNISAPTLLPNGLYVLECWLSFTPDDPAGSNHIFITFNITNPTGFISLIGPGNEVGTFIDEVFTPTPVFAWQGDAQRYRIRVWEKLAGQRTFDEVIGNNPHVDKEVFAPTFQYPVGGVRVLEPGKTYFWQVSSLTEVSGRGTPRGTESAPFVFRMADNLKDGKNPPYSVQLQRAKDLLLGFGIDADWLKDADFVSFSVEDGNVQSTSNNTDINALIDELKQLSAGQ